MGATTVKGSAVALEAIRHEVRVDPQGEAGIGVAVVGGQPSIETPSDSTTEA